MTSAMAAVASLTLPPGRRTILKDMRFISDDRGYRIDRATRKPAFSIRTLGALA
jgi:hypothetical protein